MIVWRAQAGGVLGPHKTLGECFGECLGECLGEWSEECHGQWSLGGDNGLEDCLNRYIFLMFKPLSTQSGAKMQTIILGFRGHSPRHSLRQLSRAFSRAFSKAFSIHSPRHSPRHLNGRLNLGQLLVTCALVSNMVLWKVASAACASHVTVLSEASWFKC